MSEKIVQFNEEIIKGTAILTRYRKAAKSGIGIKHTI